MSESNAIERILLKYLYGNGSILRQAQDDNHGVMVSLSNHDRQLGLFSEEFNLLAESTSGLSKLFTRERANLPSGYLKDKNLRNAYILYFLQANLYKIHTPLRELSLHPANLFLKDRLRILDLGSGPGTAILGILDFFAKCDKKPFLEFVAVDSVAENLRDAEGLVRLYMEEQKQEVRSKMQEVRIGKQEVRSKNQEKNITTEAPPPLRGGEQGDGEQRLYSGEPVMSEVHTNDNENPPLFSRGGMGGYFSSECSISTIKSSIERIKKLPTGAFDIIVLSNLLSEIGNNDPDRIVKRVRLLKNLLNYFMSDNGSCIIIEPALRETSRDMLHVRDRMLEEGLQIYSPCLMNKQCPALDNPKDWCHEDIPWNPTELIQKIDSLTGLRKDSIKFSYLVIRKDKISLADLYGEAPMTGAITTDDQNPPPLFKGGRGGVFSSEDSYRIVSEPLISKGKIEFYICGRSGRNLVVRLDKDRSSVNKVYDELKRGDVISCRGLVDEGKRLKVNKETEIEILERHRLNI